MQTDRPDRQMDEDKQNDKTIIAKKTTDRYTHRQNDKMINRPQNRQNDKTIDRQQNDRHRDRMSNSQSIERQQNKRQTDRQIE